MAQVSVCARHSIFLPSMMSVWSSVRCPSLRVCPSPVSLLFTSSLPYSTCTLTCTPSSMWTATRETPAAPSPNEEYCTLTIFHPPTSYEPNVLDDFHYSETSEMILQEESGDKDAVPSYLLDAEPDDETILKALSSPLFIQEREEPADLRQAYHSHKKVCCQLSLSSHTSTGRPEPSSSQQTELRSRHGKRKNQDSPWKTKKTKSSLKLEQRFRSTNFKPILIGGVFRNWMELLSLSEEKLITLLQMMNNFDEINYFFMNNYQNKIGIFVKLTSRVFMKCKNWREFTLSKRISILGFPT